MRGILDDRRPLFLGEGERAEDLADAMRAMVGPDGARDEADLRTRRRGAL